MASVTAPAGSEASDAGQPAQHSAEVEEIVKALENLRRSYQDRASELNKEHIGVWIREITRKVPAWSTDFDHVLEIRSHIRSTMRFVLDQYEGITRLNKLDDEQRTPLRVAMHENSVDCVEILLARGADPDVRSGAQTPFQRLFDVDVEAWADGPGWPNISAFCGIFYLRNLVNLWQQAPTTARRHEHMAYTCRKVDEYKGSWIQSSSHQEIGLDKDILMAQGPWIEDIGTKYRTWVHVTFTNVPALYNICRTIEGIVNKDRSPEELTPVLENFCSVIRPPVVTPGNSLLNYRDSMYCSLGIEGKKGGSAMVFPYLVLERISNLLESRAIHQAAADNTGLSPESRYGDGDGTFLGLCLDRTLDEAYFPSMADAFFEKRNKDQVVSREWRRSNQGANLDSAPLLVVSQTWLWNFNNSVLLSAHSIKRTSSRFPRFVMRGGRMVPCFFGHGPAPSIELQMGLIIASQISEFGEEHDREDKGSKFKSALHMFETAVISALSDVQLYLDASPGSYNIMQQKKKERDFIHHMSDIHSELDMITSVLEQQKKIMNKFLRETKGLQESATDEEMEGWAEVKQARALLNDYTERVEKIHRDADRVDKTIESYLNLKRTYASIEDTRNSLMVGFAATAFAFVTVIFTPLSFMTSLFALPVDQFARQQYREEGSEDSVFKSSYVARWTGIAGAATWVLTIALLVGLYYYWKMSSRLDKDEEKTVEDGGNDTNKASAGDTYVGAKKNEEDVGAGYKSSRAGGLRGAKLWRRKSTKGQTSSV